MTCDRWILCRFPLRSVSSIVDVVLPHLDLMVKQEHTHTFAIEEIKHILLLEVIFKLKIREVKAGVTI